MDWLKLNESVPVLHRWMTSVRLLMHVHPRVAASRYAVHLGLASWAKQGWNRTVPPAGASYPPQYVHISAEGGITTTDHPGVPESEIHDIRPDDLEPLVDSYAWAQLVRITELATARPELSSIAPTMHETLESIRRAGEQPIDSPDEAEAREKASVASIGAGLNAGDRRMELFTRPVLDTISDILAFRTAAPTGVAVVATLLARYAVSFPNPVKPGRGTAAYVTQADHLLEVTETIAARRDDYDLGGWCRLTYLAYVVGSVARYMYDHGVAIAVDVGVKQLLRQRALYADELLAHDIAPSLFHPLVWMPFGPIEHRVAVSRDLGGARGLYAPAVAAASAQKPDELFHAVREYSSDKPDTDLATFLQPANVLSEILTENLGLFLVTMAMGQTAR